MRCFIVTVCFAVFSSILLADGMYENSEEYPPICTLERKDYCLFPAGKTLPVGIGQIYCLHPNTIINKLSTEFRYEIDKAESPIEVGKYYNIQVIPSPGTPKWTKRVFLWKDNRRVRALDGFEGLCVGLKSHFLISSVEEGVFTIAPYWKSHYKLVKPEIYFHDRKHDIPHGAWLVQATKDNKFEETRFLAVENDQIVSVSSADKANLFRFIPVTDEAKCVCDTLADRDTLAKLTHISPWGNSVLKIFSIGKENPMEKCHALQKELETLSVCTSIGKPIFRHIPPEYETQCACVTLPGYDASAVRLTHVSPWGKSVLKIFSNRSENPMEKCRAFQKELDTRGICTKLLIASPICEGSQGESCSGYRIE